MNYPTIKVGVLKEALAIFPDDSDICFSGLSFYRLKKRGETLVAMEFNEVVDRLPDGRVVVESFPEPTKKAKRTRR
jgi:hypothetical protein